MKKYFLIILSLLLSFSCMKEKGTYDIFDLEYITVDSMLYTRVDVDTTMYYTSTYFSTEVGERIIIEPFISYNDQNKEEDMVYNWRVYASLDQVQDTVSTDKVLDITVTTNTGSYWFFFDAINTKTGLKYKKEMDLVISGGTSGGVLFLSELDGQANVGLFNNADVFKEDVYQAANDGETVGTNPVCIDFASVQQTSWMNHINIFCNDGVGGCAVNYITLRRDREFSEMFFVAPETIKPEAYYLAASGTTMSRWEFLINDGKLHSRDVWYTSYFPDQDILYKPAYVEEDVEDYHINKYAVVNSSAHIFYDDINRRFRRVTVSGITSSQYLSSINNQQGVAEAIEAFDPDDVGLDLVYINTSSSNMTYAVMKDPNDASKLYRLKMYTYSNNYSGKYVSYWKQDITTAVGIGDSKAFAMSKSDPYLFYAVDGKIYRYDIEYDINLELIDITTLAGGANAEVDVLHFANQEYVSGASSVKLYVAYSTVGGTGRCGSVARLQINRSGEVYSYEELNPEPEEGEEDEDTEVVDPITVFENVIGKAVSITYKN